MSLKICENNKEISDYIKYQVQGRKEISVILSSETLRDIIDELKSYGRTLRISSITTDSDSEEYLITKYLNEIDKECLMIEPLYQYNIETTDYEPVYVKDENVIVEEYVLEEDELKEIVKSDEYELIGLTEDHEDENEIYGCKECMRDNDYCNCDNCHLDTEEIDEEEQELESFLEEFVERIQDTQGCPGCIMNILKEIYCEGYVMGSDDEALSLYNALHDRLYGED